VEGSKDLQSLVDDWIAAWNARDLDRIMGHYADSVVFEANTVVRRWDRPDGRLRGIGELREHFRRGLELAPAIHFELEEVFLAPSGYAALYRRDNGNRVLDVVELNDEGKAEQVKAYYLQEQR
jgi:ketosteroid isomerase-like protein